MKKGVDEWNTSRVGEIKASRIQMALQESAIYIATTHARHETIDGLVSIRMSSRIFNK